jgi:hypothetical protein
MFTWQPDAFRSYQQPIPAPSVSSSYQNTGQRIFRLFEQELLVLDDNSAVDNCTTPAEHNKRNSAETCGKLVREFLG